MKKTAKKTPSTTKKTTGFAWNEVTPVSKLLATVLFVVFPFVAFILGMMYQQALIGM